eukprot:693629-Hanusia_phi.AAC.1
MEINCLFKPETYKDSKILTRLMFGNPHSSLPFSRSSNSPAAAQGRLERALELPQGDLDLRGFYLPSAGVEYDDEVCDDEGDEKVVGVEVTIMCS